MSDVVIRPAQQTDLAALVAMLADEDFFTDRLARQSAGHGVLLTAWKSDLPVGVVYLWLEEADEAEVREHLPGVPLLNHIEVHHEHRNQGVGTDLLTVAEQLLAELGYDQVVLAVRIDNVDAQRLYDRLAYKEWPYSTVVCMSVVRLADGSRKNCPERCYMLVKRLRDTRV
jgi:ribosomal protein S18 acetylase RimI-like enzyme